MACADGVLAPSLSVLLRQQHQIRQKPAKKTSKMLKIKQNDHSISVEISKAAH